MKKISKILLITICLSLLWGLSFAQTDSTNHIETDEEFNLFLFTLLLIGVSGIIGSAIIGAIGASLVLFFFFDKYWFAFNFCHRRLI